MSRTPRLLHPAFLRKIAVISILGGLAVCVALFRLRALPVLFGLEEWAGLGEQADKFIIAIDGLFAIGLLAHLAAILIVLRDRNPGLVRFVRRSVGGRRSNMQVVPPSGAPNSTVEEPADEFADEPVEERDEEAQTPLSSRLAAAWSSMRATMRTRRGPVAPRSQSSESTEPEIEAIAQLTHKAEDDEDGV